MSPMFGPRSVAIAAVLAAIATPDAFAQDGPLRPSLEGTLAHIRDQMVAHPTVVWTMGGSGGQSRRSTNTYSDVTTDPANCTISFTLTSVVHGYKLAAAGERTVDAQAIDFKKLSPLFLDVDSMRDVAARAREVHLAEAAAQGYDTARYPQVTIAPDFFLIDYQQGDTLLQFADRGVAQDVAQAMAKASRLCEPH